jgi:hypothetical protein
MRPVAVGLVAVALFGAGCGSAETPSADGGDEIRMAGVDFKGSLGVAEAIRVAREYDLVVYEVVTVRRAAGEELSGGFFPDPNASPEEVERNFLEEDPLSEVRSEDLPPEQRKATEQAAKAKPVVRDMTVCGPRDTLFEFEDDQRVKDMVVAPKRAIAQCPQPSLDSDT